MCAVSAMRAAAAAVAVAVSMRLAVVRCAVSGACAIAVQTRENAGDEEEDAIHDAEREGGLEHSARLVNVSVPVGNGGAAKGTEADVVGVAARNMRAVGSGNHAQRPHRSDKSAHKQKIEDGNEGRVGGRAVVAKQRVDRPRQS